MPIQQIYTLPINPVAFRSRTATRGLPLIVNCPAVQMPPFNSANLGDLWDCIRCGLEPSYDIPFRRGDIIPLQLNLRDLRNLSSFSQGWRDSVNTVFGGWYVQAQLLAGDCQTVIYNFADEFCADYWVARSNLFGDVQALFVDTNLLPIGVEKFQIKISLRGAAGSIVETWYTEMFVLAQCTDTVLISATSPTQDCLMHDYRVPAQFVHTFANGTNPVGYTPTAFRLDWRYFGEISNTAFRAETTENDNGAVISTRNIDVSTLRLTRPIPPFIAQILAAQTRAQSTLVDGERYRNFADFDQGQGQIGRMFLPEIECERICDTKNFGCD